MPKTLASATKRLDAAYEELQRMGYTDVKFAWGFPEKADLTNATVAAATALESIIDHERTGKPFRKFEGLNDSYGLRPPRARDCPVTAQPRPGK